MSLSRPLEQARQLITDQLVLPSPPAIAVQILNTVQKDDASLSDLAKVIAADPALTAKLLRVANSSFYSLPNKVTSIERALTVLGTNVVKNIALSFAIAGDLRGENRSGFDFDYFWRRSVTSAVAAQLLSSLLQQRDEDIFVTALLHDIGILILYQCKGEDYSSLFKERLASGVSLVELERQKFGFDHQVVGATLIRAWELPASISEPICYHHEREEVPETIRQTAKILSIAGKLSSVYDEKDSAVQVRGLQKELTEQFELDEEQIRKLVDDVANEALEILKTFDIDAGDLRPFSQMLQEANEQLGKLNLSYEYLVLELKEAKEKAERLASELRRANLQLKEIAFRDGLTGLYNHRYFQEILAKELVGCKRNKSVLSLVLFDLDYFKKINDTYGHPAGDLVLINIARAATSAVRESDVVSRYGGEEFAVILPETDQGGLKVFAERMRRSVEKMVTEADGHHIEVTISAGGAVFVPGPAEPTKEQLIDAADKALYASKKNGRNQVTVNKS